MKKILIPLAIALTIASCGGGTTAPADKNTEQPQASPDKERIAYNILNTIAEIKVDNFDKDAFNEIYWNGENDYYEHLELIIAAPQISSRSILRQSLCCRQEDC